MDNVSKVLLQVLNEQNSNDTYKVVSIEDIGAEVEFSPTDLNRAIRKLNEMDYINVKFHDNENICYKIVRRLDADQGASTKTTNVSEAKPNKNVAKQILGFCGAMAGAFLGVLVFYLIFVW